MDLCYTKQHLEPSYLSRLNVIPAVYQQASESIWQDKWATRTLPTPISAFLSDASRTGTIFITDGICSLAKIRIFSKWHVLLF